MTTKSIMLLNLLFFGLILTPLNAQQSQHMEIEKMIQSVESNLLPPVRIAGEAPWTIAERMAKYNVPVVSIAADFDLLIHRNGKTYKAFKKG